MVKDDINKCIENAPSLQKEVPQPLRKQRSEPADFPIDSLPSILRDAALGIHDKIQAPYAICAQSVLSAANLAVQGHADIMLPFGQVKPLSCFFLTIAESGERKTSCDSEALVPIKAYESRLNEQHNKNVVSYQNAMDVWEKDRSRILKQSKGKTKDELDKHGKKPDTPLIPLIICPDPTFEGLCKLMEKGQPSLGIFSSEGGQFIGGYGMKEDNKIRTAAALSSVWDGEPIKRVRKSDDIMILEGRRLSMHLMIQPNIAAKFLSDQTLKDQGLLSRILIASPVTAAGTRLYHHIKLESHQALDHFKTRMTEILNTPLPLKEGCINHLIPRVIQLAPDTIEQYKQFSDDVERRLVSDGKFESIKGLANKLPEHAIRLATTMALIDDIQTETLNHEYLQMGINLASYYADEALRLYDEGMTDPNIIQAENLINWLHNHWEEEHISLPDIYQRGPNSLNTKDKALSIVKILEDHGWLERNPNHTIVKTQLRKDAWKIIKTELK